MVAAQNIGLKKLMNVCLQQTPLLRSTSPASYWLHVSSVFAEMLCPNILSAV